MMPRRILITVLLTQLCPAQTGPELQIAPEQILAGRRIDVDLSRGTQVFRPGEKHHAVASFLTDTGVLHRSAEFRGGRCSLSVPARANYVYVYATSRRKSAGLRPVGRMIYSSPGHPQPGARLRAMMNQPAAMDALLAAELRDHPQSLEGYRLKWLLRSVGGSDPAIQEIIRTDLQRIRSADHPQALWARSYGLMLLGKEPAARSLLLRLLADHAKSLAAARALSDYRYQCYTQRRQPAPQVLQAAVRAISEHPDSPLARDEIRNQLRNPALSMDSIEAVCAAWQRRAPGHPEPEQLRARALWRRQGASPTSLRIAEGAAASFLRGELRLRGDSSGSMSQLLLASSLRMVTEMALDAGQPLRALGAAATLERIARRAQPAAHAAAARAWRALEQSDRAAQCWVRALDLGDKHAAAALEELQPGLAPGVDPETWRDELRTQGKVPTRPAAKNFRCRDLAGAEVVLRQLRGKVVVLNFWSLGCAPCKVEIPHLNKLARSFAGPDVVFLALGTDAGDKIAAYLRRQSFAYRQLPASGAVAARYGVRSWPTHVFIDKQGRIAATFVGGGEDVAERFSPVIAQLLRE